MSEPPLTVSAILLCYDSEAFVADALRSALAQDYGSLEILVSDDASQDGTFEVVQRELASYRGPHRVAIQRRATNSGSKSAHLNYVFPSASGDIIVSFDADDISETHRVSRLVDAFRSNPRVQAVYSAYSLIDAPGRALGLTKVPHPAPGVDVRAYFARVDSYASGATLAIRRTVVETFGALDGDVHEDVALPFRASLLGTVAFIDEPLVRYRRHAASMTADFARFGSMASYRLRQLRGIEQARRNLASRLADLRVAGQRMPGRAEDWEAVRDAVLASMSAVELSAGLVSPFLRTRVSALLRLIRAGAYRDELRQHVGLALMPELYLAYKRFALRVGRKRADRRPG